ncbi:MAG: DUF1844 domain-containing protein [Armatimonadetes bacterium]|nr:DUF1844 domain-containing protein [Armatimonadota bacterium]
MANEQQARPADVNEILMEMTQLMATMAWQKMGLQPDMATGQIHKDVQQAKTAVDVAAALAGFLEPQLDDDDRRQLRNMVSDLRINYVQQAGEGR